mgnify:CR=1 FL=1
MFFRVSTTNVILPWMLCFGLLCALIPFNSCSSGPVDPKEFQTVSSWDAGGENTQVSVDGGKGEGHPTSDGSPDAKEIDGVVVEKIPGDGGHVVDSPLKDGILPENKPKPKKFRFWVTSKTEDTVPPKIKSFSFSKKSIQAGESISFSIVPDTDLSGVISAQLSVQGPKKKHSYYALTSFNTSAQRFDGVIKTSRYIEPGVWKIQRISLLDAAGNPSIVLGDQPVLKGATFTVINPSADISPPVCTKVTLEKKSVVAGNKISYWLEASDKGTGLKEITLEASPSKGGSSLRSTAFYHPVSKRYQGYFFVPKDAENGGYVISRVDLSDRAENFSFLGTSDAVLKGLTFTVSGGVPSKSPPRESNPPTIHGMWISPEFPKEGDVVRIVVSVSDKGSGVRFGSGVILDPLGAQRLRFDFWHNPARKLWEAQVRVPLYSRSGWWPLDSISFSDHDGNQTQIKGEALQKISVLAKADLDKVSEHLGLQVLPAGAQLDRKPPVLKGLRIAPGEVSAGMSARVYARLEDPGGSGISSASCTFQGPNTSIRRRAVLSYNSDTGFYEGNLRFSKTDSNGRWWVSGCYLVDNNQISSSVPGFSLRRLPLLDISKVTSKASSDPFGLLVKGNTQQPVNDTKSPELLSFRIAPSAAKAGEKLMFFAKAKDDGGSGISDLSCKMIAENKGQVNLLTDVTASLSYHSGYEMWVGTFQVPLYAMGGQWWLQSCELSDNAGNSSLFQGSTLFSLPATDISSVTNQVGKEHRGFVVTAVPPKKDTVAPKVTGIALYPPKAAPTELIRVFVKASDNVAVASGFCSMKPSISEAPNTSYGSVPLQFNSATSLWEGNFRVGRLAKEGYWSLARCFITDSSGNEVKLDENQLEKLPKIDVSGIVNPSHSKKIGFEVSGSQTPTRDQVSPEASSVAFLPADKVSAGEKMMIRVKASDKDSGVSRVSAMLSSPTGKFSEFASLERNLVSGFWEGFFSIPVYSEDGTWKLTSLTVSDRAGNRKSYSHLDALLSKKEITVSNAKTSPDKKPPELTNFSVNKKVVLAGNSVRVYAKVSDDSSGVASVSVSLLSPSKKYQTTGQLFWNAISDRWEGEVKLPKEKEDGIWSGYRFVARDHSGKSLTLNEKQTLLKSVQVKVNGSTQPKDTKPPEITNLSVLPIKAIAGKAMRIFAKVSDDLSGVKSVSLVLKHDKSGRQLWSVLEYNPATKWYERTQYIPTDAPDGAWRIDKITLEDHAGNEKIITNKDPFLKSP